MNVSITNVDEVNAIIEVNIAKADYQGKVESVLKNYKNKANIPGFRPGKAPISLINKMYGKSVQAEEINKLVGETLYNYIQENKLNVLGEPLPNEEKQKEINFETAEDFDFFFDVALAPKVELSLSKKDKINYYAINIDQETLDKQIESYKANFGKYEKVENEGAKETDLLKGLVVELADGQPKVGGIKVEKAVLMPSYMKNKEEEAKFVGVKAGDKIVFNPGKAYEGNEAEIASLLQISKEDATAIAPEFQFEVEEVTRYQQAELNQELFDKVFGKDEVKSEEEFINKVKETIAEQFKPDSDYKFMLDAKEVLFKKVGEVKFPSAFLKRWMLASDKEKNAEELDKQFPKIEEDLKFHLIKEAIAKENDIKIEQADMKAIAVRAAQAQFAQYGMTSLPAEMVENYAEEMLKDQNNARNLFDRAMEDKIADYLKSKLGVTEKTVSLDEFRKFFETEDKAETAE